MWCSSGATIRPRSACSRIRGRLTNVLTEACESTPTRDPQRGRMDSCANQSRCNTGSHQRGRELGVSIRGVRVESELVVPGVVRACRDGPEPQRTRTRHPSVRHGLHRTPRPGGVEGVEERGDLTARERVSLVGFRDLGVEPACAHLLDDGAGSPRRGEHDRYARTTHTGPATDNARRLSVRCEKAAEVVE